MGADRRRPRSDRGFTLIELLVVMSVIAVLAAIAVPTVIRQVSRARDTAAKSDARTLGIAVTDYFNEYSSAPSVASAGGHWLVGGVDVAAVSQGVTLGTVAAPPAPTTTADTTGWTSTTWCLNVLHPGGSKVYFKFSAQSGLQTGSCASASAP